MLLRQPATSYTSLLYYTLKKESYYNFILTPVLTCLVNWLATEKKLVILQDLCVNRSEDTLWNIPLDFISILSILTSKYLHQNHFPHMWTVVNSLPFMQSFLFIFNFKKFGFSFNQSSSEELSNSFIVLFLTVLVCNFLGLFVFIWTHLLVQQIPLLCSISTHPHTPFAVNILHF